jgi:hypothetical protein
LYLPCFYSTALRAATDWKVIKVGNRDYLSVENIAKFYGFPTDVAPPERLSGSTTENSMVVLLNSRAIINSAIGSRSGRERDGRISGFTRRPGRVVRPQFRPQMIRTGTIKTVVLDPGHSGHTRAPAADTAAKKTHVGRRAAESLLKRRPRVS